MPRLYPAPPQTVSDECQASGLTYLTAATLWSLIASAERHGLDPQRYLTSLFAKLPLLGANASPADLAQFLPDVWKAEETAAESV